MDLHHPGNVKRLVISESRLIISIKLITINENIINIELEHLTLS